MSNSGEAKPDPAGEWYVGSADGQREGPLSVAEMKRRIASGKLTGKDLVWKQGQPNWIAAGTIPELFGAAPAAAAAPARRGGQAAEIAGFMRMLDGAFSRPAFYRVTGRVCAVAAIIMTLVSIPLFFITSARQYSSFTGAMVLALFFFVGEAAGAVLESLGRSRPQGRSAKDPQQDS